LGIGTSNQLICYENMGKILMISPSTLDRKSLLLTLMVSVAPVLIFGGLFFRNLATNHVLAVILGIMALMSAGILVLGIISTPYKYILTNSQLIIKRHYKDIVIPLQNIKQIRLMTSDEKKGMLRTIGFDGAFGSWGYYSTSAYKELTVFTRRYDNRTLIITDRKKYVIAPDDLQLIDAVIQQTGQSEIEVQQPENPVRKWISWLPVATILAVAIFIYSGYKEPKVELDSIVFRLKGRYGVNIPLAEMSRVDTISWREMPTISIRTNGISLFKVNRGNFRTTAGDRIRMSVHCGVSPVIRIVDHRGAVYYINHKNAVETRLIFNKLQK